VGKAKRLQHHDYASNGTYFVTICTRNRRPLLVAKVATLVERELLALPARIEGLSIDCWKVMPDHLHVLVHLNECGATLSEMVQAFKSLSWRAVRKGNGIYRVWQRGFHDRIVRREKDMERLREYIRNNDKAHAKRRNSNLV
jgi:REP element-mobilizing transposase RayT